MKTPHLARKVKHPAQSPIFDQMEIERFKRFEQFIKRTRESHRLARELVEEVRKNRERRRQVASEIA